MADPAIDVKIAGAEKFRALAKKLADPVQRDLRLELQKAIRAAAEPALQDLKRAVEAIDSRAQGHGGSSVERASFVASKSKAFHGGSEADQQKATQRALKAVKAGKRGLRATISRSIKLKVRTTGNRAGMRIVVDSSSGLPESQRRLPKYLDSDKGWRHPVFGHRNAWVQQYGKPWWSVTIDRHRDAVRERILTAMHTIADKVKESL